MRGRGKARLTLRPGDPGTKRLTEKYGTDLVAVRYRYDESRAVRSTTVELVVEESRWIPEKRWNNPERLVGVRVGWGEQELQRELRLRQGRWDGKERMWWVRLGVVVELRLESRIVSWGSSEDEISRTR